MDDEPIDLMKPWTIKSAPNATREAVTEAARKAGLTVGQWLEKRVTEWTDAGSPERVPTSSKASGGSAETQEIADLVALMNAAAALAAVTKLPSEVRSLISQKARSARGLPSQQPRQTKALKDESKGLPRLETDANQRSAA